jgi:hypothetical protein
LAEREKQAVAEVLSGNVPNFLRRLCPVEVTNVVGNTTNHATFFVTPDYLAIGSDADYLLTPLSPQIAQAIADRLKCSLPTRKMVDAIYRTAAVRLPPSPIPPSPAMTALGVFSNHNFLVWQQRSAVLESHPLGALVAGHKKDVVISTRLSGAPGKVAIYGWHETNGAPIQKLYLGHSSSWVDYSQCIRLIDQRVIVNDEPMKLSDVLADPSFSGLVSDEGPMLFLGYSTNRANAGPAASLAMAANSSIQVTNFSGFHESRWFGERVASFSIIPDIKVHLNMPGPGEFHETNATTLIFYALPNGNDISQTIGRQVKPSDDWHFDIQHIGAQTRFLRRLMPERNIVVIYLESGAKSWPAWRKNHADALLPKIVREIKALCPTNRIEIVFSGHSGGGSFIFGYLNALEKIPDEVVRVAFLDSDYAYDANLHHDGKLVDWLKSGDRHYLCVLAYDDANALLDGKTFVSASGGTWGRSHALQADLAKAFQFQSRTNAGFERFSALDGRIQFLLKQNPERKIFHTIQVEKNGFIHSTVSGTPLENKGYDYFGNRAYSELMAPEPEL